MATETTDTGKLRIPVTEEVLRVGRRVTDTGRGIRIHKTVSEETLQVDEALQRQELQIEHVTVNAWVDGAPPVQRQEGDTLVIPVLEEVLVVQKRLKLTKEIRITARTRTDHVSEQVVLRKEQVAAERFEDGGLSADKQGAPPP